MNLFGIILVIFATMSIVSLQLQVITEITPLKDYSHPGHPGKCVFGNNLIFTPGHHQDPNDKCKQYECREDLKGFIQTTSRAGCDPEYVKEMEEKYRARGMAF